MTAQMSTENEEEKSRTGPLVTVRRQRPSSLRRWEVALELGGTSKGWEEARQVLWAQPGTVLPAHSAVPAPGEVLARRAFDLRASPMTQSACQCRRHRKRFRSLGQEDPLEEGMATHSSSLAWRILMDRRAWWATVHGITKSHAKEQLSLCTTITERVL